MKLHRCSEVIIIVNICGRLTYTIDNAKMLYHLINLTTQ